MIYKYIYIYIYEYARQRKKITTSMYDYDYLINWTKPLNIDGLIKLLENYLASFRLLSWNLDKIRIGTLTTGYGVLIRAISTAYHQFNDYRNKRGTSTKTLLIDILHIKLCSLKVQPGSSRFSHPQQLL